MSASRSFLRVFLGQHQLCRVRTIAKKSQKATYIRLIYVCHTVSGENIQKSDMETCHNLM